MHAFPFQKVARLSCELKQRWVLDVALEEGRWVFEVAGIKLDCLYRDHDHLPIRRVAA